MKWCLLMVLISTGLFHSFKGFSQDAIQKEQLSINGVQILLYKYPSENTGEEVCEVPCDIKLIKNGKQVYYERICAVDVEEVQIILEGYLTVIRHYSSPVGWSKAYIIDLCKERVIETKELGEGTEINWIDFIELSNASREKYVENISNF